MADISQITLPSGTTYDIKDAVARAKAAISVKGNTKIFYTSCQTPASTAAKTMSCTDFDAATDLVSGTILFVFFETANDVDNITFEINNSGAKPVAVNASITATNKAWKSGEVGCFIFNETADFWIMVDSGQATTDYYGVTKLSNATNSTSQDLAATSKAVKDALDAAKAYADGLDTGVSDVTVDGTSVVTNGVAAVDLSGKVDKVTGKGLSTNDYTTAEQTKLAGIETGAEANVIETVKVNGTALTPDSDKAVDVTVPSYSNATSSAAGLMSSTDKSKLDLLSPKGVFYAVCSNGSTDTALTASLVGTGASEAFINALSSASPAGTIVFVYFVANIGFFPNSRTLNIANTGSKDIYYKNAKTGSYGVSFSAGNVVPFLYYNSHWIIVSQIDTNTTYSTLTQALVDAGTETTGKLVSAKILRDSIDNAIAEAEVGSAAFQGVVNSNTDISGLSDYKRGWYWVVGTAGEYLIPSGETEGGQPCEVGDFIFCISDRASAYAPADFKIVQANIDMSQFGALAFKDTATGNVSVTSSDAVTSVSHGLDSAAASGDDTVLKDVTNSAPSFTGTQKYLHLSTSKDTVTSTGTASVTTSGAVTAVSGSVNTTSTNGIDIKPAGTVSTPTITVTPSTTTKYVASSATGGGTVTDGTAAAFTATVSNENLTFGWTANTPTAVTLPSFSSQTIATGITSATSTQPSFTGTQKYLHLSTTKDTVTSTGSISVTTSDAVTAVSGSVNTTASGGIDIKPAGSVSAPTLTKTYVKPKVTATKGTTTSTGTVTVS